MNQPRRRFGQNFLRDQRVIDGIVAAIAAVPGQHIVEIGPGQGALTEGLAATGAKLSLIEIDRDLAAALPSKPWWDARIELHCVDALKQPWSEMQPQPLRVVGNLPYNISTPLLFRLLEQAQFIDDLHLMLQKEVVQRLCAQPGTPSWGRLSVATQLRARCEVVLNAGPGAFWPPPKVDSQVVRITPIRPTPLVPAVMDQLLRSAFSARRKTLRNALRQLVPAAVWSLSEIDPSQRAEVLNLDQWRRLASELRRYTQEQAQ